MGRKGVGEGREEAGREGERKVKTPPPSIPAYAPDPDFEITILFNVKSGTI